MARKINLFGTALVASMMFGANSFAQDALVHMQGKTGDREAYYITSWIVWDRTDINNLLGATAVKELAVTTIYENAQKPEMASMNIRFECPSEISRIDKKNNVKPLVITGPVKFKIGAHSYILPRENLKETKAIPESQWQTSDTPVLTKLRKYACHNYEIDTLFRNTIKQSEAKKSFDINYFRAGLTKLNMSNDVVILPQGLASDLILNTWRQFWLENEHPDPTGAWHTKPTKEEIEKYNAQIAKNQATLNELRGKAEKELLPQIKDAQQKFAFRDEAAQVRGNRKKSKSESLLIQVWESKTEDDILRKYGNPHFINSGNTHILTYGNTYDNTSLVTDLNTGATWEEGAYASCDINFITIPDNQGIFRIADVRITAEENRAGNSHRVCQSLFEVPN